MLACRACGGVWLDNASTQKLVQAKLSEAAVTTARLVSENLETAANTPYRRRAQPSEERPCPMCRKPLVESVVPEIGAKVDVCAEHGTWFDRYELHAVHQVFAIKEADADAFAQQFRREAAW